MNVQRKKPFWPVTILLIVAACIALNNFYFHLADESLREKPIAGILKTITVDDLIAMVFWEKDNSEHIWKEILEERRNGQRDQERLCYARSNCFLLPVTRLPASIDEGPFPSGGNCSWSEKDGAKGLEIL